MREGRPVMQNAGVGTAGGQPVATGRQAGASFQPPTAAFLQAVSKAAIFATRRA